MAAKILIGVLAGVFTGLFFGDLVAWMSVPGDIFIGLLQMTVLPYIIFSLIVNIGRLSPESGKQIVKYGLIFLGLLLSIGLVFLMILPMAFPHWDSGSFYSSDFVQEAVPLDFVKLYIPANPFASMSNNVVPAVVVFSIFVGLGIMRIPDKENLLKPLDVIISGLNQVNKIVVQLTPLGVYFIAAGVVSKLSWTELSRLQGYILIYLLAVLILTFIVLPAVITTFTPYSGKQVLAKTRSTLLTIFATGKIIVVYPQLIADIKEILREASHANAETDKEVEIIMPLAYPFPNLGTLVIFVFVPFAAWYTGKALVVADYPLFLSATFLSSFVAPISGLPFSLDLLHIPADTFQLFVLSNVITDRIRVVLGAFHLITLTILTITASAGMLKIKKRALAKTTFVILLSTVCSILGMNILLQKNLEKVPTNKERINNFNLISPPQPFHILAKASPNPTYRWRGENILSRIKRRGILRVGFYRSIPFSFYNSDSLLVGYGIDLAHLLAADLGVSLEFVPIDHGKLIEELNGDYFDIVMSDIFLSSHYAEKIEMSKPYLNVSLALLVPVESHDFDKYNNVIQLDTFTVAYIERNEIAADFLSFLPNGGAYPISHVKEFIYQSGLDSLKLDAYLTSAERAAALTVFYPDYKVVNPLPYHLKNALVFPIIHDAIWKRYIDNWIDFRMNDGSFERIYNQWILGREFHKENKTWSIYQDVIMEKWLSKEDSLSQ